ncbi:MAG: hypothetical protein KBT22_00785, partial [Bacteroidales bacterium]|nr:hypothetical protein [Candidatus Scybalocola fimicaballi]
LFKFTIAFLMMVLSSNVYATVLRFSDYTEDFNQEDRNYYCDWTKFSEDQVSNILAEGIDVLLEFYDTKGNQYVYSLLVKNSTVPNGGIDISRPMILHFMSGDIELPVKWYWIGYGCWIDNTEGESNRSVLSAGMKFFIMHLFACSQNIFYMRLCDSGTPITLNKIGPFANISWSELEKSENKQKNNGDNK